MAPIAIAQLIIQLLPYGIQFTTAIINLLHTANPTLDDWVKALALAQTPFDQGLQPGVIQPDKAAIVAAAKPTIP